MVPSVRISSSTLSRGRTASLVCTPRILARASLEKGVTSATRRTPGSCIWRLTVFAGSYAASDEEGLPQTLTLLLRTRKMVATGLGLGHLSVSLFRMMNIVTTSGGARICRIKAWLMTL